MTDSGIDTAPVRLSPGDPAPEFTLPDADGLKWFNRLYLRVTEAVAGREGI